MSKVHVFVGNTSIMIEVHEADNRFDFNLIHIMRKFTYSLYDFTYDSKVQKYVRDKKYFVEEQLEDKTIFLIPRNYLDKLIEHLDESQVKIMIGTMDRIPERIIDIDMNPSWVDKNEIQSEAIDFLVKNTSPIRCLSLQMGCLAGDTVISLNRGRNGFTTSLKNAYEQFNGLYQSYGRSWDRSIPTFCRSYLENEKRIGLNKVIDITYSGMKEIYRLTLSNGKYIDCTKEHRIKTSEGWVEAQNCIGKDVMCDSKYTNRTVPKYKKLRDKNFYVNKNHPYKRKYPGAKNSNIYLIAHHRAVYEAHINNMTLDQYKTALKDSEKVKTMIFIDPKQYAVHHKDYDHYNNDPNDLTILSHKEHNALHGRQDYRNFSQGIPTYSKGITFEFLRIDETFDIEADDPNHNFSANDIIVHNSGKSYCSDKAAVLLKRPYIIIVSGMLKQWKDNVLEHTTLKPEEVYVIKGSKSIFEIMENNLKPKCVIASLETIRNFAQRKQEYDNFPYSVQEVFEQLELGAKIIDECHLNFHAIMSIDLVCNIDINIYLSATFIRTNSSTNRIFKNVFPNEYRYGEQHRKNYINVVMVSYASDIQEKFYTFGGRYSHLRYEKLLFRTDKSYRWFWGYLLRKPVQELYLRFRKEGQKLLILMGTINVINKSVEVLQELYPNLVVKPFTGQDPESNLSADIIVSTLGSAGTGRDIPGLIATIDTVSYAAEGQVKQTAGRLREINDQDVWFMSLYNRSSESHIRHASKRELIYKELCKSFNEMKL